MKLILSYIFYFLGDLVCKIMHLFKWWGLYKYYNHLMGKSGEFDKDNKFWKDVE